MTDIIFTSESRRYFTTHDAGNYGKLSASPSGCITVSRCAPGEKRVVLIRNHDVRGVCKGEVLKPRVLDVTPKAFRDLAELPAGARAGKHVLPSGGAVSKDFGDAPGDATNPSNTLRTAVYERPKSGRLSSRAPAKSSAVPKLNPDLLLAHDGLRSVLGDLQALKALTLNRFEIKFPATLTCRSESELIFYPALKWCRHLFKLIPAMNFIDSDGVLVIT